MPVILTKNYRKRIGSITGEVLERLAKNDSHTFVYVAPTKRKIRDLQREFLQATPGKTAPAFNLFTLETLAAQLYVLLCPPRRQISGPEQAVLIDEAIMSVSHQLQYFRLRGSPKRLTKGTLLRIINVINALKEKGVYLTALRSETDTVEKYERPKLNDILLIYEKYEQLLGDRFADSGGLFKHVNEQWDPRVSAEAFSSHFGGVDTIFVSGFDEFANPELTMLNNLSNVDGMGMVISFDYNLENDEVFGHLKENYEKFLEMGFKKITTKKSAGKEFHRKITECLFQPTRETDKFAAQSRLTVIAAKDRRDEADIIAKIIRHLIREQPKRPIDKICVATFRPDLYTQHFREIFEQYGIPANITDRYYLDQSPIVVAILSLLMIHQRDFMVSDIMRALSSVYVRLTYNGKPIDAGALYESAYILKITGGFSAWIKKIGDRLRLTETRAREADHERDKNRLQHEADVLRDTEVTLHVLRDLLKNFDQAMTPRGFKERLLRLIDSVNLTDNILRGRFALRDDDQLEKDTRALEKFLDFIDEFLEILALEGKGEAVEHLPFYLNRLRESMTQVRYNIRQKYGYGVAVTSMDETRGLDFDVMILAGMVDAEFPPVYRPEIFFSSTQRLLREKYHLHEHRYLFYQMLCNFTEHLYITYPQTEGENELIQSTFIDALMEVVDVEDSRQEYPPFLSGILYTKLDAVRHIGIVVGNGGSTEHELGKIAGNETNREIARHVQGLRTRMDVEKARMEGGTYPEFRGIISGKLESSTEKALSDMRNRIYSVTQLETYGKCPFHYFAERLLRLNVIEEIDEELTPLERGGLIHDVLFEFYLDRRIRGLKSLREVNDKDFSDAFKNICDITKKKLSSLGISSPFWELEEERIFGSSNRKGVLQEFLEFERDQDFIVSPSYFEAEFGARRMKGKGTDPSLSTEIPISTGAGTVRLRGKIDRIDTGDSVFRIIDYKTGATTPDRESIDKGVSLQLPVYLYAVEEMLKRASGKDWKGVAGVYYVLTPKVKETLGIGDISHRKKVFNAGLKSKQLCANESELRQVIQRTLDYVNEYVDKIAAGQFPVEPKVTKKVCEWCDHKTICRIQLKSLLSSETTEEGNNEKE